MDERMKFVGRLLSGETMVYLCREFGISWVTGHKIWNRYREYLKSRMIYGAQISRGSLGLEMGHIVFL
mgnify:CR=1 FL=1